MSNSSKKTPWHLRFAPGAILRPIGRLASQAVSLGVSLVQTVRQRLNQWNWRKKTALVTALAITAAGVFYQNRAHAAAFTWPTAIAASVGTDFLVSVFASYASSSAINSKIKKTANANPDGDPLYTNREYYKRVYSYDESGTETEVFRIDADADALYHKAYETSGTDTRFDPTTLEQSEVLDEVSRNANLNGTSEEYEIMEGGEPLYTWSSYTTNRRRIEKIGFSLGGYVTKPTDEEIQEELDEYRESWNRSFQNGTAGASRRPGRLLGPLTKGRLVRRVDERFVCDKEVRLWSKFEFNRVPGDTSAGPKELQTPGDRSTYVTEFSYIAREAGYDGGIVTKVPENETPFFEYPKPKSYVTHNYKEHDLDSIIWGNYKIIGDFTWTGEATRFFKHRKVKWCIQCNQAHPTFNWVTWAGLPWHTPKTRHEYPVYQNETVEEPAN